MRPPRGRIVAFTRSLAKALVGRGIRVNGVAPGPIWTPLIPSTFPAERVAAFGDDVPMQRAGQPEEVAPSYVFLASDDASYGLKGFGLRHGWEHGSEATPSIDVPGPGGQAAGDLGQTACIRFSFASLSRHVDSHSFDSLSEREQLQVEGLCMLGMSGVEGVAEAGAYPRGGLKVFAKRARKYGRSPSARVGRSAITLCRLCALSFLAYPSCANIPPRQLEL
jgi:Enoyl-(Acyl carrier protein) reductase